MAIVIQGNSGTNAEVEANSRALRVVLRPDDFGSLGIFNKAMTSGTMAAGLAAASNVYSFRWSDATKIALIRKVVLSAGGITAFTAGIATFNLFPLRSFSASMTGGTAGTLTGNIGKLKTAMATTVVADIRISSTAALAGSSFTADTDPIGGATGSTNATAGTVILPPTNLLDHGPGLYPLNLVQNEGFTIQATVPATGTWGFSVQVEWEELAAAASYQ